MCHRNRCRRRFDHAHRHQARAPHVRRRRQHRTSAQQKPPTRRNDQPAHPSPPVYFRFGPGRRRGQPCRRATFQRTFHSTPNARAICFRRNSLFTYSRRNRSRSSADRRMRCTLVTLHSLNETPDRHPWPLCNDAAHGHRWVAQKWSGIDRHILAGRATWFAASSGATPGRPPPLSHCLDHVRLPVAFHPVLLRQGRPPPAPPTSGAAPVLRQARC